MYCVWHCVLVPRRPGVPPPVLTHPPSPNPTPHFSNLWLHSRSDRTLADASSLPPPIGEDDFSYPPAPYPQAPGSSASHSHYGSDASAAFGRGTAYSGAGGLMSPAMSSTPSVGVFSSGGRYGEGLKD